MKKIMSIMKGKPTLEGAGVRLKRAFGPSEIPRFDPFLLLDHFGSDNPADYIKGFPWHPHRGIETVTYMVRGEVNHADSIGNEGAIRSGDIQWMTAGSGIIHQEMPQVYPGNMMGFQLWINLPRGKKMTAPRYMGVGKSEVPQIDRGDARIKVVAGALGNRRGPVKNLNVDVEYLDVRLSGKFRHRPAKKTSFVFVYEGSAMIDGETLTPDSCVLLSGPVELAIDGEAGFLLVSGDPLNEPIAWGGPIVMNTQAELRLAFQELDDGTFIKGPMPAHIAGNFYR